MKKTSLDQSKENNVLEEAKEFSLEYTSEPQSVQVVTNTTLKSLLSVLTRPRLIVRQQ